MKQFNGKNALAYLMDIYKLPLNTIADKLFINKTLVSKWKNVKRRISPEYAQTLAQFFYEYDKTSGLNYLPAILGGVYPDAKLNSAKAITDALAKWLSGFEDRPKPFVASAADATNTYQIFLGRMGILKAIRFLAAKFSEYPPGSFFYFLNARNIEWFANDTFQKYWIEILEDLFINYGLKLRLIHMMDWRISEIKNVADTILEWDLKRYVDNVFYTGGNKAISDSFVIIIPDFAVLRLSYDETAPDNILCSMFFDSFTLNQQMRLCDKLYAEGPRLIDHNIFRDNAKLIVSASSEVRYISALSFPLFPVEPKMLADECGLSDSELKTVLKNYPLLFDTTVSAEIRYILSLSGLKNALRCGTYKDETLSTMFKRDIYISEQFIASMLKPLLAVKDDKVKFLILTDDEFFPRFNIILDEQVAFCYFGADSSIFTTVYIRDFMLEYYHDKWKTYSSALSGRRIAEIEKLLAKK